MSLYTRTGEANGVSTAGLTQGLADEATTRAAADTAVSGDLAAEATDRANADAAETTARTSADTALNAAKVSRAGDTMMGALVGTTAAFTSLQTGGGSGPTWTAGSGAPTATAPIGSLYSNTAGAVGARLFVSAGGGTWTGIPGV